MSTLQELLIKRAGMEKEARTAIAKRLWASTMTPEKVVERFGKVKGNRYLDDMNTSIKNHFNNLASIGPEYISRDSRFSIRRAIADNMVRQLHFNNKISKPDYLRHIESDAGSFGDHSRLQYAIKLNTAGSRSGLSDLYGTLPRQDKLTVSKYLRGMVPESGLQHLSTDVQKAAQKTRTSLLRDTKSVPDKDAYAPTLQTQYGITSRGELLKEMQDLGIDFNPDALKHSHYVTGSPEHLKSSNGIIAKKHALLAATRLPYTTPDRLPAQAAAATDVWRESGKFDSTYFGSNADKLPRSAQKALQMIKGENLLEPGTRANRLFNKVYNNKTLYNKLGLRPLIHDTVDGSNAAYMAELDAILVHPKALGANNTAGIAAHELGHRAANTMAPEAHAAEAFNTFRRMQLVGNKHNMKVPINDAELMQEVFAESYIPKLLGPNSGAARFVTPRQMLRDLDTEELTGAALKGARRDALKKYKANKDAIDAMNTSEDMKDLFRQLAFNYRHYFV